jgi:hypothetical protein
VGRFAHELVNLEDIKEKNPIFSNIQILPFASKQPFSNEQDPTHIEDNSLQDAKGGW